MLLEPHDVFIPAQEEEVFVGHTPAVMARLICPFCSCIYYKEKTGAGAVSMIRPCHCDLSKPKAMQRHFAVTLGGRGVFCIDGCLLTHIIMAARHESHEAITRLLEAANVIAVFRDRPGEPAELYKVNDPALLASRGHHPSKFFDGVNKTYKTSVRVCHICNLCLLDDNRQWEHIKQHDVEPRIQNKANMLMKGYFKSHNLGGDNTGDLLPFDDPVFLLLWKLFGFVFLRADGTVSTIV